MFEKVNPQHPDKVADRIAGAIVDLCYDKCATAYPKVAVEVLLGHGQCNIIIETSENITSVETQNIVKRIAGAMPCYTHVVKQDEYLAQNQQGAVRCGDNGIFRGCPTTAEQATLSLIIQQLYKEHPTDGKFIIDGKRLIICQSYLTKEQEEPMREAMKEYGIDKVIINPLGYWTGGSDVDSGATNRKLGSDMGEAVTGGGLHGKDLSKADVSVNICCHFYAQEFNQRVEACTAIGDEEVTFRFADGWNKTVPYDDVVEMARNYIYKEYGSFEAFAEWGLVYVK